MEEAGDWRLRSLERSLRRILWGTSSCIDRHGSWNCALDSRFLGWSFQASRGLCIAPSISPETLQPRAARLVGRWTLVCKRGCKCEREGR